MWRPSAAPVQAAIKQRVTEIAAVIGLTELLDRKPKALSGGQRQRVAIARALVNNPSILLADEPTGNLDSTTSAEIMKVFEALADQGQTVIMVTHEADIAAHARRVVVIRDGRIASDDRRERFVSQHGVA
jgi:putative ABC transport system ATP-binding protein